MEHFLRGKRCDKHSATMVPQGIRKPWNVGDWGPERCHSHGAARMQIQAEQLFGGSLCKQMLQNCSQQTTLGGHGTRDWKPASSSHSTKQSEFGFEWSCDAGEMCSTPGLSLSSPAWTSATALPLASCLRLSVSNLVSYHCSWVSSERNQGLCLFTH